MLIVDGAKGAYQKDLLNSALLKKPSQSSEALSKAVCVSNDKFYIFVLGQPNEFRRLFKIPRRWCQLEYIEFLFHRRPDMFVATIHTGGNQQTPVVSAQAGIHFYYQLPVIVVGGAVVFRGHSFGELGVFVGDGLNPEIIDLRRRFEQELPALIETEYRSL